MDISLQSADTGQLWRCSSLILRTEWANNDTDSDSYSSQASDEPYVPTMCRTGELCKWSPTPHPIPSPPAERSNETLN